MRTTTTHNIIRRKEKKSPQNAPNQKKNPPPKKNPFKQEETDPYQSGFSPLRYTVKSTIVSQTPFKKACPPKYPVVFKYHFYPMSPQKITYQQPMKETLEYTPGITEDRSFTRFNYSFKETKNLNPKLKRVCSEDELENFQSIQIKPSEFEVTHQILADENNLIISDGKEGNKNTKEEIIEDKKEIVDISKSETQKIDKNYNSQNHSIVIQNRVPKIFSRELKYKKIFKENNSKKLDEIRKQIYTSEVNSPNPIHKSMTCKRYTNLRNSNTMYGLDEVKNHKFFDSIHNISKEKGKDYEFGRDSLSYVPVKRGVKYKGERFKTLAVSKSIPNLYGTKTKKYEKNNVGKLNTIQVERTCVGGAKNLCNSYKNTKKNTVLQNLKTCYNNLTANVAANSNAAERTKKYKLIRKEVYEFVPEDEVEDHLFLSRVMTTKNKKNQKMTNTVNHIKYVPVKTNYQLFNSKMENNGLTPDNFSYLDSNTGKISEQREQIITNYI